MRFFGRRTIDDAEKNVLKRRIKKLESSLKESRELLGLIMQASPDIIYRLDRNGNILSLSGAITEYGYTPDEMIGRKLKDLIHPDDSDKVSYCAQERRTGKRSTKLYKLRLLTKDRNAVHFELNDNNLDESSVFLLSAAGFYTDHHPSQATYEGTIGIARDITERLVAKEALDDSEYRFRQLFQESNDALFIVTTNGIIVDANKKACEIIKMNSEALHGRSFISFFHENEKSAVVEAAEKLIQTGSARMESRLTVDEDSAVDVEICAGYVTRERNHIQVIVRDISERKQVETILRNTIKEKEVLMKELHHRVKNNIQVIASILSLQIDKITDERYRILFSDTMNRIKTMGVIHTLLYQSEDFSHIRFQEYTREIVDNLFKLYAGNRQEIGYILDIDDVYLKIDNAIPSGLIINELVTNALIHGFPAGHGGYVYIGMKRTEDGDIRLTVKDNGIGLANIPDWRNHDSLGLTIVRLLSERQLGGTITLNHDNGSEYIITYPG